jgi:hypothetical protein
MTCQNGLSKISNELLGRKPVVDNDAKLRPLYLLKILKEQTDEDLRSQWRSYAKN